MSDCACEASVALSAYARVSNRHSALTSECGSMLEEVWATTLMLIDFSIRAYFNVLCTFIYCIEILVK